MPELALPSSLAVVALGLAAAAAWGTSDFGGGLLGRRAPLLGALAVTQGIGFVLALAITVLRREPLLAGPDLLLALGSGLLAAVGIGSLYGGLALGRMGVVAPVAAVLTALTPALIGIVLEGVPKPLAIAGMALAIVAVVIVSTVRDSGPDRPSGLPFGVVAGLSLGVLSFALSRIDDAYLIAPLAAIRAVQLAVFATIVLLVRRPWRPPRATWPLAFGVGAIDLLGNTLFLTASRIELAPAAVVSSLYPVVTVLLAAAVLRERMTGSHVLGIGLALTGVAMIAAGTTT
ncbi:MAG TPA: DMT family transporter [Candidatus Limnocylindrales bacterium]|nr:DMT family transporter [Candidatus Limnocylindrales bacterium]